MKKSKLSVGLVTTFIGALALAACGETVSQTVTPVKDVIIDFVGYNSATDKIEIKTGLYDKISDSDEGTKLYYDSILESLIRHEYDGISKASEGAMKSLTTLTNEANDQVKGAIRTASDTAAKSGTTFEAEWNKTLESHDCKTTDDLLQHYLYDLEKQELADYLADDKIDDLKTQYIGVGTDWKNVEPKNNVDAVYPYHILHSLVKLSADKSDYVRGTITQTEATKLWAMVRSLLENKLAVVAADMSEDDGSKSSFGDTNIMNTNTSFYNEFKLGIYAYDAILSNEIAINDSGDPRVINKETDDNTLVYKGLGLDKTAQIITETSQFGYTKEFINKDADNSLILDEMVDNVKTGLPYNDTKNIPTVPYEIFKRIGEMAEDEKLGTESPEAGDVALPRNVLFNQFLNFHSPFVITDEDIWTVKGETMDDDTIQVAIHDFENLDTGSPDNTLKIAKTNFTEKEYQVATGNKAHLLTDGEGNIIIGVRSEAGIHFMSMRKSIFKGTNDEAGHGDTTLQEYYTTIIPGKEGYPEGKQTYVEMAANTDASSYEDRADKIRSEIESTSFDAAFDYRIYEFLTGLDTVKDHIKFCDEKDGKSVIRNNINAYIERLRKTKQDGAKETINNAWTSYLMMLKDQNFKRSFDDAMVKTTCAFRFNTDGTNADLFKKDGACYVK